jgi:hypothetical protein
MIKKKRDNYLGDSRGTVNSHSHHSKNISEDANDLYDRNDYTERGSAHNDPRNEYQNHPILHTMEAKKYSQSSTSKHHHLATSIDQVDSQDRNKDLFKYSNNRNTDSVYNKNNNISNKINNNESDSNVYTQGTKYLNNHENHAGGGSPHIENFNRPEINGQGYDKYSLSGVNRVNERPLSGKNRLGVSGINRVNERPLSLRSSEGGASETEQSFIGGSIDRGRDYTERGRDSREGDICNSGNRRESEIKQDTSYLNLQNKNDAKKHFHEPVTFRYGKNN